jgi:hypothetical protein
MGSTGRNFGSDNITPASPEVIDAITAANTGSLHSYGDDPHTRRLTRLASELFETEVAIYPQPVACRPQHCQTRHKEDARERHADTCALTRRRAKHIQNREVD